MRIKIEQWEVLKAVELYFKNEYGVDCDLVEGLQEWPLIDYQDRVLVTKKHKNGRGVKSSRLWASVTTIKRVLSGPSLIQSPSSYLQKVNIL